MPDTLKAPGLHVTKIGARLGVVVHGIDAKKELTELQRDFLQQALRLYKVLFLKRQFLDEDQHEKLSEVFGEPILHPTIAAPEGSKYAFEQSSGYGASTDTGHTDITFIPAYPKVSISRALEMSPFGGATVWANTAAAYDDLPEPLKRMAELSWGIHSNDYDRNYSRFGAQDYSTFSQDHASIKRYVTKHPIVIIHPETEARHLLLGHFIVGLDSFPTRDANTLIELLQRYVTRIENTVSWHWEEGDVAIWDNRATHHYAPADFEQHQRRFRRITVKGEVPIGVEGQRSHALVKPS